MMNKRKACFLITRVIVILFVPAFISCGPESSPEGRMSTKLENLQEIVDSLRQQNKAILDSLGGIREDLNGLKQQQYQR